MVGATTLNAVIRAARPTFRSKNDKVAFAVHSSITLNGLQLLAVGAAVERLDIPVGAPEVSVDGWNSTPDEMYAFLYSLPRPPPSPQDSSAQEKLRLLVKCIPMDDTLVVSVLRVLASAANLASPDILELSVDKFATDAQDVSAGYQNLDELLKQLQPIVGGSSTASASCASAARKDQGGVGQQGDSPHVRTNTARQEG
eukprot:gene25033-10679_t